MGDILTKILSVKFILEIYYKILGIFDLVKSSSMAESGIR